MKAIETAARQTIEAGEDLGIMIDADTPEVRIAMHIPELSESGRELTTALSAATLAGATVIRVAGQVIARDYESVQDAIGAPRPSEDPLSYEALEVADIADGHVECLHHYPYVIADGGRIVWQTKQGVIDCVYPGCASVIHQILHAYELVHPLLAKSREVLITELGDGFIGSVLATLKGEAIDVVVIDPDNLEEGA